MIDGGPTPQVASLKPCGKASATKPGSRVTSHVKGFDRRPFLPLNTSQQTIISPITSLPLSLVPRQTTHKSQPR